VEAKDDGVTVVTRPSASVVATPTAEEAVRSVGVEMDAMELAPLDDGVTKSVDVLLGQQNAQESTN
jgi:hypothetical protein